MNEDKPNKLTPNAYTIHTWNDIWNGLWGTSPASSRSLMQVEFKGSRDANGPWVRKLGGPDYVDHPTDRYTPPRVDGG